MTQGDPLSMVTYGNGVILMTKNLKAAHPDLIQPWYIDYMGALSNFVNVKLYFNSLKHSGPDHGYYPKPSKIVIIMHPGNPETGKRLDYVTGLRFALSRVTLPVLSGTTSPNGISCRISRQRGRINLHNHQNSGEISPISLRCGGPGNPIRVDIFAMYDEKQHIHLQEWRNFFAETFYPASSTKNLNLSYP